MSDIVERLNDLIGEIDTTGKCSRPETASVAMEDARDELTRLREQVTDLQRYQQALRFIAISLQEHFDGIGMEVSSSYHHCVVLPDMIRAAIQGKDQPALSSEERALLTRFMEDEPKDRPDRVVEMLRGMRAKVSALEDVRTVLKREADALKADNAALRAGIGRCYRMLLSEPVTKRAAFKAENILRNLIESAPVPAAAPVAQGVPDGWQIVPVEATEAMLKAAVVLQGPDAAAASAPALLAALTKIYRAMLSAAPQPPVVKESLTTEPPPTATEDAKDAGGWRERFCEKCHHVFYGKPECCGMEAVDFDVSKHGRNLIGSSNSWLQVWNDWGEHPRVRAVLSDMAENGNFGAATALSCAIEDAFRELDAIDAAMGGEGD